MGGRDSQGVWDRQVHTAIFKMDNQTYYLAHRVLLNTMWRTGWDGSLGKNVYVYPWVGKIPLRRAWQPTPVFLPGESPWMEEPDGHSPWGCKESEGLGD